MRSRWSRIVRRGAITAALLAGGALIAGGVARRLHASSADLRRTVEEQRRALDEALAQQAATEVENARLLQELQEKTAQVEAAVLHRSEFLAGMSHELRTPLNAVIGFSEVLSERIFGDLNDKQAEYLHDILSSGRHLLTLINDILDIAKVEAGRMELELGSFSLPEALEQSVRMVKERAARHGIALTLVLDPALGMVRADERKLKQVLFNLLANAVTSTPDDGSVELRARLRDAAVEVAVADMGVGIPVEQQAGIFDEFHPIGAGRVQEETGLGLPLARKFVELHGGRIGVESIVGTGTTFTVTLPLLPLDAPGGPAAVTDPPAPTNGAGCTVLVIEDDPHAIDLLTLYLADAGFRVEVARDGEQGLELARRLRPAAVVLDILLPRIDGWDVLVRTKADPDLRDIPVIVVSILDERGKGFALGAADYLVKPVGRDDLLAALGRALPVTDRGTVLAVDDDPLALALVEAILAPEGYRVLTARGGEEGIALARSEQPALVVLDLLMPGLDGFAVIEALRADPATATIPIVILTSKSMNHAEKERLRGRISYLARKAEFDRATFVQIVRAAGGSKRLSVQPVPAPHLPPSPGTE